MAEFSVRSDSVNVEQIMEQIRARIREKRGVDYTEEQIRELAAVKLQKFLDPRGVRSDLLEQFRRTQPPYAPPELPNYAFEDKTLFDSHRGSLRFIRKLLNPILKLFFNPNPLIQALNIQSRINTVLAEREARLEASRRSTESLYYELIHNLVVETTRLGIEVKNLSMRIESMSSRLEFNERRARALESAVVYKPGPGDFVVTGEQGSKSAQGFQGSRGSRGSQASQSSRGSEGSQGWQGSQAAQGSRAPQASPAQGSQQAAQGAQGLRAQGSQPSGPQGLEGVPGEGPGQRSRRRRRRRGRRGGGSAAMTMQSVPGSQSTEGSEGSQGSEGWLGSEGSHAPQDSEGSADHSPSAESVEQAMGAGVPNEHPVSTPPTAAAASEPVAAPEPPAAPPSREPDAQ